MEKVRCCMLAPLMLYFVGFRQKCFRFLDAKNSVWYDFCRYNKEGGLCPYVNKKTKRYEDEDRENAGSRDDGCDGDGRDGAE